MRRAAAAAVLVALAGCGGSHTTTNVVARTETTKVEVVHPHSSAAAEGFDPQTIYRTEAPGVVTVIALDGGTANIRGRASRALGSGFVVDPAGYIATNAHVVTTDSKGHARAHNIYVIFADGNEVAGRIVGTDLDSDVALIKIDPSQLRGAGRLVSLPLGSTSELAVGDPVAAIGSPFGDEQSLSVGVVSGLGRDIGSLTDFDIGNAIQTDAAINHGSSGGPLLDAGGKVVGINSQIASSSGGGEGVGFAIPAETVKHSIAQLRAKGKVAYAFLGTSSVGLYPQLAVRLGIHAIAGVLIDKVVTGSPAARAGLRDARSHINFQDLRDVPVGSDVILEADGHRLAKAEDLSTFIGLHQPGDTIELGILRDGKRKTVSVKLASRPEKP